MLIYYNNVTTHKYQFTRLLFYSPKHYTLLVLSDKLLPNNEMQVQNIPFRSMKTSLV